MWNIIKAFGFPLAEGIWLHIVRYFKRNEVSSSKRHEGLRARERSWPDVDLNAQRSVYRLLLEILLATSSEPVGKLPFAQPSRLSRLTWRERSFLKVSRCRARRAAIEAYPWLAKRYFGTLGIRRARIGRRNVSNATTSLSKANETNEAQWGK